MKTQDFDSLVVELAKASRERFHTATVEEGLTEIEAFYEIVRVILEEYRARMMS